MLPTELLLVWKRKSEILPRFAKMSTENLEIASKLIDTYQNRIGEKKQELKTLANDFEKQGHDYRLVRALMLLLDRKAIFACSSKIDPVVLRRKVFEEAEKSGLATTPEIRKNILEKVASELSLSAEEVEENFYADLEDELILERLKISVSPPELLEEYNLSLTQTLLFNSTELRFTVTGNWQRLFALIKRLGLIYEVQRNGDLWVKIDGPASLFRLTRRYGVNIAKLFPAIAANNEWKINAKIFWRYSNEICNLNIESHKQGLFFKKYKPSPVTYDSSVEESFASQFNALKSGWQLKRELEPLSSGRQVVIPDFSLERSGLKIYLEIVGFWTEEYLQRKVDKLSQVKETMLLLVDEKLACEKLGNLKKLPQLHIMYYQNKFPLSSILDYLGKAFEKLKNKEINFLKELKTNFTEEILHYEEFASRLGISVESVRTRLIQEPPTGYLATHNSLVSQQKIGQIKHKIEEKIGQTGKMSLMEATELIEAEGINDVSDILEILNYKVTWHGINSQLAEISKIAK
jgi:predicted nuclease of restriction endonuclease-like RecB superfamily